MIANRPIGTMALNYKQQAFVEYYLTAWNATEAARLAGYKHPHVQGARLLSDIRVRAAIDERLRQLSMGADEVLARLSQHASASMEDFIDYSWGVPRIDLQKAATAGKLHLIKKLSYDKEGRLSGIELHDSQSALVQIGRYHKLFTDKVAVVDWRKEAEEAGLNVSELYQQLVNAIAANVPTGDRGDAFGGDS